jgi:hypothetical protein
MEDALISPEGFMILSGAGLVEASEGKPIYQHVTETVDASDMNLAANVLTIRVSEMPYLPSDKGDNFAYVMLMKNGEIISEPFIPEHTVATKAVDGVVPTYTYAEDEEGGYIITVKAHKNHSELAGADEEYGVKFDNYPFDSCLIDYYTPKMADAQQIEITADKFGGNYYLEASTLFRDTNGVDMPAEFIIPNCKVQSNFTFTMASNGDPSSFTFTMDAFPDYTRFNKAKKVLAAIQIIKEAGSQDLHRHMTKHEEAHDLLF